jgi:hypothetical protein
MVIKFSRKLSPSNPNPIFCMIDHPTFLVLAWLTCPRVVKNAPGISNPKVQKNKMDVPANPDRADNKASILEAAISSIPGHESGKATIAQRPAFPLFTS